MKTLDQYIGIQDYNLTDIGSLDFSASGDESSILNNVQKSSNKSKKFPNLPKISKGKIYVKKSESTDSQIKRIFDTKNNDDIQELIKAEKMSIKKNQKKNSALSMESTQLVNI